MFAEEKPALLPLPLEPFRYHQHGKRGVNLEVNAAYYGLPPGWIGREVNVQWDQVQMCAFSIPKTPAATCAPETRLVSHQERRPSPAHAASGFPVTAGAAGTRRLSHRTLCNLIHTSSDGFHPSWACSRLAKKFGVDASAAALEIGVHEYRFVRYPTCPTAHSAASRSATSANGSFNCFVISSTSEPRSKNMNLIELNRKPLGHSSTSILSTYACPTDAETQFISWKPLGATTHPGRNIRSCQTALSSSNSLQFHDNLTFWGLLPRLFTSQ